MSAPEFIHRFVPATEGSKRVLLLLHGTGGDENDLLPIGRELDPNAALLSPRGRVIENGMPRFFRRFAEGVFDEEDVVRRANELPDFISAAASKYDFVPADVTAVGYSNGANIAAAMTASSTRGSAARDSLPRDGAALAAAGCGFSRHARVDHRRRGRSDHSSVIRRSDSQRFCRREARMLSWSFSRQAMAWFPRT